MKRLIKTADYADSILLVVGNNVYEGMDFQTCIYKYQEQTGEVNKTSLVTKSKSDLLREISTYNNGQQVITCINHKAKGIVTYETGYKDGDSMSYSEKEKALQKLFPEKEIMDEMDYDEADGAIEYNQEDEEEIEQKYDGRFDEWGDQLVRHMNTRKYDNTGEDLLKMINKAGLGEPFSTNNNIYHYIDKNNKAHYTFVLDGNNEREAYVETLDFKNINNDLIQDDEFIAKDVEKVVSYIDGLKINAKDLLDKYGFTFEDFTFNPNTFLFGNGSIEIELINSGEAVAYDNGAEISRTSIDDLNDEFFESLNI